MPAAPGARAALLEGVIQAMPDDQVPGCSIPHAELGVPAAADAHHALSEYHAYAAIAVLCGDRAAEAETAAPLPVHAARLAAALGDAFAELAWLRVIAANSPAAPGGPPRPE